MDSSGNKHLTQLWPVTILTRKFDQHQAVNTELITLFRSYREQHELSPGSGYASPDNFATDLQNWALESLQKHIMDCVYEIACELNQKHWGKAKAIDIDVTGMWFQISNDYAFHETHVHGNCSWSGVYYVQAGSSSKSAKDLLPNGMPNGVTRFYGPHTEYCAAGHGDWGNYYLQESAHTSYPEDGQLVVFPSYLKHMVYPYKGELDRIIVSFHAQVNSDKPLRYGYAFS